VAAGTIDAVAGGGFDPAEHVGETVSFEATARDAAGGAMVLVGSGLPIYIRGLARWPKELAGKRVSLTGELGLRESQLPATPPGGVPAHGIPSATYVLDDARWEAAL
jgi:hypothetical protein